uniref:Uncharacterized protein n=1 Tax=Siphoviridae sp. ctcPV5 TaxID=2827582 RepID=A0A8S5LKP4_9CAUD|nr:MAG TPA: hypothetical protein [Siphoviridae sp. ctcPV5]
MEFLELVKDYEDKHGSFSNADFDDADYIEFRVKMIMLENKFDKLDAFDELVAQVANPSANKNRRKKPNAKEKQVRRELQNVLYAGGKEWLVFRD